MRVKQKGNISLYTIDFGATIDRKDMHRMREAVKNCSKVLEKTIGKFIYHSGHIFAMQGQVGDEAFDIPSSSQGQECMLRFTCR